MVHSRGGSNIWKKMVNIREEVEHDIWWQIKDGNSSFWFDNWTKQVAFYFTEGEQAQEEEVDVNDLVINGGWNEQKLKAVVSYEMVQHIIMNIRPPSTKAILDKAWQVQSSKGDFTVKSAFHIFRRKKAEKDWSSYMW